MGRRGYSAGRSLTWLPQMPIGDDLEAYRSSSIDNPSALVSTLGELIVHKLSVIIRKSSSTADLGCMGDGMFMSVSRIGDISTGGAGGRVRLGSPA